MKEVAAAGMKVVPPAVAFRKGEWNRKIHYEKRGKSEKFTFGQRQRGERDDSIRVGARMLVINTIRQMRNSGHLEQRDDENGRHLRLSERSLEREREFRGNQHLSTKDLAGKIGTGKELLPGFFVAPGQSGKLQFGLNLPEMRWELRDSNGEVLQAFANLDPDDIQKWTLYARNSK